MGELQGGAAGQRARDAGFFENLANCSLIWQLVGFYVAARWQPPVQFLVKMQEHHVVMHDEHSDGEIAGEVRTVHARRFELAVPFGSTSRLEIQADAAASTHFHSSSGSNSIASFSVTCAAERSGSTRAGAGAIYSEACSSS